SVFFCCSSESPSVSVMPHYRLTYFDLRARAEPIRMLFSLAGIPFEDERCRTEGLEMKDWVATAMSYDPPVGALPMLEVDGVKIGQTIAILRYMARETGYAGSDNLTTAIADSLADQYIDYERDCHKWHIVNAGY
ncbi:hypothetical protein PMAYCL1PPCAC_00690, partial [Pristionchus mayeri]